MERASKTRMVLRVAAIAVLLAAAGGGGRFLWTEKLRRETDAVAVRVAGARVEEITETLVAEGRTVAAKQVRVEAQIPARVEAVLVEVGQRVEKGQVLATLEKTEAEAALRQARIQLEATEKKLAASQEFLKRYEELYLQKIAPIELVEHARRACSEAEYEIASAKVSLEIQERRMTFTSVAAPVGGVVSARLVHPGEFPSGPIFAIDSHGMEFMALIDERVIDRVAAGEPAEVVLAARPGKTFTGKIRKMSPGVATEARNIGFPIWVDLGPSDRPMTGLTGYVRIRLKRSTLVIPATALTYFSGDRGLVFSVKDLESQLVPVIVGASHQGRVEVLGGLSAGDQVVIEGQEQLRYRRRVVIRDP